MKTARFSPPAAAHRRGFTLLELLTVLAIMGLLVALIGPNLGNFKPNVVAAATQQLQGDIARARQLAIGQHTTVYMVFVQPGFWTDQAFAAGLSAYPSEYAHGYPLLDKQLTGYNFVALRSVGDQPGRHFPRYLTSWKSLPAGSFIPPAKFLGPTNYYSLYTNSVGTPGVGFFGNVSGFPLTASIPFPTHGSQLIPSVGRYTTLSCIAFNYLGQLVDPTSGSLAAGDEYIPLAKGSVVFPQNPGSHTNTPPAYPNAIETPAGNSVTNSFNVVRVDRLTGRTFVVRQEIK